MGRRATDCCRIVRLMVCHEVIMSGTLTPSDENGHRCWGGSRTASALPALNVIFRFFVSCLRGCATLVRSALARSQSVPAVGVLLALSMPAAGEGSRGVRHAVDGRVAERDRDAGPGGRRRRVRAAGDGKRARRCAGAVRRSPGVLPGGRDASAEQRLGDQHRGVAAGAAGWQSARWNGKLEALGGQGWAGTIGYAGLRDALRRGYAATATDSGHSGGAGTFALEHPEQLADFAYRSAHEMTLAAKAIVTAFYGNGPRFSYWDGCSTGGRMALTEAQRFPDDFDGIIAGAPANFSSHQAAQMMSVALAVHPPVAARKPRRAATRRATFLPRSTR